AGRGRPGGHPRGRPAAPRPGGHRPGDRADGRAGGERTPVLAAGDGQVSAVDLIHHLRKRSGAVVRGFAADTPVVRADPQKLRQVFLNLLTNAGDAMPGGGTLTLRTAAAALPGG